MFRTNNCSSLEVISVQAAYTIFPCIYGVSSRKREVIATRHPPDEW